mmetsp:Transcript_11825/g.24132  ORF Transcript_11825/g.24132 Transcript_11825/m.24132 type:complete len:154 (-) Transcript_11825:482-943(-)
MTAVGVLLGEFVSTSTGDETTFCPTSTTETLPPIGGGADSPFDTVTAIATMQETTNSPEMAMSVLNLAFGFVLISNITRVVIDPRSLLPFENEKGLFADDTAICGGPALGTASRSTSSNTEEVGCELGLAQASDTFIDRGPESDLGGDCTEEP